MNGHSEIVERINRICMLSNPNDLDGRDSIINCMLEVYRFACEIRELLRSGSQAPVDTAAAEYYRKAIEVLTIQGDVLAKFGKWLKSQTSPTPSAPSAMIAIPPAESQSRIVPEITEQEFRNNIQCLESFCHGYLTGVSTRQPTEAGLRAWIKTIGPRMGLTESRDESCPCGSGWRGIGACPDCGREHGRVM